MEKETLSLYVHWPWCLKKCPYCDFNSHVANKDSSQEYTKALLTDLKAQAELISPRKLETIFFGGGTPSLMPPQTIEKIVDTCSKLFEIDENIEISMEANPTSSAKAKFKSFHKAGINRFSIGVQAIHDDLLKFLGREHTAQEAIKTVEDALSIIENVSMDMIHSMPIQSIHTWEADIDKIVSLGTKHISAYQLTVEPNTKFYSEVKKGVWNPKDTDTEADFLETTQAKLSAYEFNNYEISNYAKQGYECRHNFQIWQYKDYMGIGAGAHGRLTLKEKEHIAYNNKKLPNTYINQVKKKNAGWHQFNTTSLQQRTEEKILMGLRTAKGLDLKEKELVEYKNKLLTLKKLGLINHSNTHISLTEKGWNLLDSVTGTLLSK